MKCTYLWRDHLISKSPYLSTETLRELVLVHWVPDAIKAEVCIANPEATRTEGFVVWLQREQLLPEYLIGSIVASWDDRTFRFQLLNDMAESHFEMTQAGNDLVSIYAFDTLAVSMDSLLWTWRQIRTPAARYAEALLLLGLNEFDAADSVISLLPGEHKLREREMDERTRMLNYIALLKGVHLAERTVPKLTDGELAQLDLMASQKRDRPGVYANNILCANNGPCRSARTGGGGGGQLKSLPYTPKEVFKPQRPWLKVQPNPAVAWVSIDHDLMADLPAARLVIRDLSGRMVHEKNVDQRRGQYVWDVRNLVAGIYMVELRNGDQVLTPAEKLVIQK